MFNVKDLEKVMEIASEATRLERERILSIIQTEYDNFPEHEYLVNFKMKIIRKIEA